MTTRDRGVGRSRGSGGTTICRCLRCGYSQPHERGIPCTSLSCPNCGKTMVGEHCAQKATAKLQQR
jgi:H+/Na+-translocating ferredoxin:NAD+ oxidoreductase subunit B